MTLCIVPLAFIAGTRLLTPSATIAPTLLPLIPGAELLHAARVRYPDAAWLPSRQFDVVGLGGRVAAVLLDGETMLAVCAETGGVA